MFLSLACWSFPALTLSEVAGVARAIGVPVLDVGLAGRSALDRAAILADPVAAADELNGIGVGLANYYHVFGEGLTGRNLSLPGSLEPNVRDLERVLTFADAAGMATVFILPGVVNPGQSRAEAAVKGMESLRVLGEVAAEYRAELCFEPHVQSWCEAPDLAWEAVERSGVKLALDYAHFACLGYRQDEIDPLAPLAAHVHLRQAKPGALQAKFSQGTLNFPAMFGALRDAGYGGALALEAVHQEYMGTLFDDVMTETIAMRDAFWQWEGK